MVSICTLSSFFPANIYTVCCLASTVHAEGVIRNATDGDTLLLRHELTLLDLALASRDASAGQRCWCLKQKCIVQILMKDQTDADATLMQVTPFTVLVI